MSPKQEPKRAGGRPRNSWTSSRKRKLVRLYTLTTLKMDEIQQVLRANDFNPSSSDVQKKLRALLPSDYAKDHRKFRPASDGIMKRRLEGLNRVRKGRRSSKIKSILSKNMPFRHPDTSREFEGPASAFRNYGEPEALSASPYLFPSLDPLESRLVNPSLLLLDGSSVTPPSTMLASSSETMSADSQTRIEDQYSPPQPLHHHVDSSVSLVPSVTHSPEPSGIIFRSLKVRLLHRSRSFIQTVQDIMRYSATDSCRSSISWCSSQLSGESWKTLRNSLGSVRCEQPEGITPPDPVNNTHQDAVRIKYWYHKGPLSHGEQMVWKEMIDEAAILMPFGIFGDWDHYLARRPRLCCPPKVPREEYRTCGLCGVTPLQLHVWETGRVEDSEICLPQSWNQVDHFNQTLLHYAAASHKLDLNAIKNLIEAGTDIKAINTHGETFLHILFRNMGWKNISKATSLLRHLAFLGFPFAQRDYYGQTVLHLLRLDKTEKLSETGVLETLLSIMQPDLDVLDVMGRRVRYEIRRAFDPTKQDLIRSILSTYRLSRHFAIEFRIAMSIISSRAEWIKYVSIEGRAKWIDLNGDTALIATLKYWSYGDDETSVLRVLDQLIALGSEIHMRDRYGNTPLMVAVVRGFRPAVVRLVECGASINVTTCMGKGILGAACDQLRRAREKKLDRIHAMIWSCMLVLIDLQAIEKPMYTDEWIASWALAQTKDGHSADRMGVLSESGFLSLVK